MDANSLAERLDYILRTSPKASIFGGGAGQIFITPRVKRIIDLANEEASRLKDEYHFNRAHLPGNPVAKAIHRRARLLEGDGLTRDRVYDAILQLRGGQRVTDPQAETRYRTLEKYSRDLTQLAREGKLDPVIGRDNEILRVMQVLSRRTKNNPVSDRRSRRGQNRHRGRAGPKDRLKRRAGDTGRQKRVISLGPGCA